MSVPVPKTVIHINDLPYEILEHIFSFLTVKERFASKRVCSYWKNVQQNLLNCMDQLVFDGLDEQSHCIHKYPTNKEDRLPVAVNHDCELMKSIISKCGRKLRFYKGAVTLDAIPILLTHCERLQCIDIEFTEQETLQLIGEAFGRQLKCSTLSSRMPHGIKSFLYACPNLISLAVTSKKSSWLNSADNLIDSIYQTDSKFDEPEQPQAFTSLKQLVVRRVHEEVLNRIPLMTNLSVLCIELSRELNDSAQWKNLTRHWPSGLKYLTINVYCGNCISFEPLPPNLEYLHLQTRNKWYDGDADEPIKFSALQRNLRVLKIKQTYMMLENLEIILNSVLWYCPAIEDLSLDCSSGFDVIVDDQLSPLLSATSLKQLYLSTTFEVSDVFITKLVKELPLLTNISCKLNAGFEHSLLNGPLFWSAVKDKAKRHPSVVFTVCGLLKGTLVLREPLPTNVYLNLQSSATFAVHDGIGRSKHWFEMTKAFSALHSLNIKIHDVHYNVSGLPTSLKNLTIRCVRETENSENDAFSFCTRLPNLVKLTISQQVMSNNQLQQTLDCIINCCPKLETLCVNRDNKIEETVDRQIHRLLDCRSLKGLCFSNEFKIRDEFGANLVNEMTNLEHFGCDAKHQLGFELGPLFSKAIVAKASTGQTVTVICGPNYWDMIQKLVHLKKPRSLHLESYKLPVSYEAEEMLGEDVLGCLTSILN